MITGFFMFLSLVMFSFINTFLSVFKGKKEYKKDLKVIILDNLLTVVVVFLVAYYTKNIQFTAISFFLAKIFGLFYAYKIYNEANTLLRPSIADIKRDLYKALPYAVHYWVGSFYLNIDTVIMKPIVSSEDLGIYQAGIRIIIGLGILLTIINSVYLPLLNEALLTNIKAFKKKVISLNTNVIRVAIICTLGLIICSKLVILVLFGEKFMALQSIFWIIGLIVGMRILGASFGILLTISNKQALRAIAGAISIVLIIISDLILVPIYGYKIAALVLLFAHLFITSFYIISIYLEYKTLFMPSFKKLFEMKIEL
jgi:O-antigen/teichoic acid export membrane protein